MGLFDNNRLLDLITNYLKTQFELIKLDIQEALEALLIKIFKFIFAALTIGLGFLLILLALAFVLNDYFESNYLGFLIVGGFSLVLGILLFRSFQQQATFPVEVNDNEVTNQPFEKDEEAE